MEGTKDQCDPFGCLRQALLRKKSPPPPKEKQDCKRAVVQESASEVLIYRYTTFGSHGSACSLLPKVDQ
jgi:hypothetical protein